MDLATDVLRNNGLKVTPQRLAIYNYLFNTKEHPVAEKIYGDLYSEYPTMSLSTVYKTLEIFKSKSLILELNVGEDSFRYDANSCQHDHFYCLKCKALTDVNVYFNEEKVATPEELANCDIMYERKYYYGYCESCKETLS